MVKQLQNKVIVSYEKSFDRVFTKTMNWDALFLNASEPSQYQNEWYLCQEQYLCGGNILS